MRANPWSILRREQVRRAFTLVEVLVVVSVLALLIAVLLPSLAAARRSAQRTACQAILSQWATAVIMYAEANKSYLPRRGQGAQPTMIVDRPEDWFNALPPLMRVPCYFELILANRKPQPGDKSVYVCPRSGPSQGTQFFAYGMNMLLSTWNAEKPDRIDRVAPPGVQVFMADGPGEYCSVLPRSRPYSPVARHDRALNVSFLDGHVAAFPGTYVGCGVGDPLRGNIRWVVPNSSWPGPGTQAWPAGNQQGE